MERSAKERMIILLHGECTTFSGKNTDWTKHIVEIESLLALIQLHGKEVTIEEVMCAMVLHGMLKAGGHWETLATMLIAEEPEEDEEGMNLKMIVAKTRTRIA